MKSFISILIVAALSFGASAVAQTQYEMNQEACEEYKNADAELNAVYKQIHKKYKDDKVFLEKLKIAQRAWIKYRDAHLTSIYPLDDKHYHYGSVYPMCRCYQLSSITDERTQVIRRWLEDNEGDVCAGSAR